MNGPVSTQKENICHNPNCGYRTYEKISKCPECGRPLLTDAVFRALGSLLVFLGIPFLAIGVMLGYVSLYATPSRNRESMSVLMFCLSAAFLTLGTAVMASGAWQMIFGRANMHIIRVMLFIFGGVYGIAVLVKIAANF